MTEEFTITGHLKVLVITTCPDSRQLTTTSFNATKVMVVGGALVMENEEDKSISVRSPAFYTEAKIVRRELE